MHDIYATLEAWSPILADVQRITPSAVVAGGALRDLFLGGEIKDLDIFVPVSESKGYGPGATEGSPWHATKHLVTMEYQTGMRTEVAAVEEFTHKDLAIPVQIIHLTFEGGWRFPIDTIGRMDFDACRVAWDGETLFGSMNIDEAWRTKTFTLVHCEDEAQAVRSLKRAARFKERYPDYLMDVRLADQFVATV